MEWLQRLGELLRAGVARGRVDLQCAVHHVAQPGRDVGPQRLHPGNPPRPQRFLHLVVVRATDGALVGQGFVQDGGGSPEIYLRRERAPLELLRREIGELAPQGAGLVSVAQRAHLGNAEVAQLDLAETGDEQIRGRDVAMHDVEVQTGGSARCVRVGERIERRLGDVHREVHRQEDPPLPAAGKDQREVAAVHVLHRQVVDLADHPRLEHLDDVRVLEHRRHVGLAAEQVHRLGVAGEPRGEPLQGDELVLARPLHRARLVHLRHAAAAEELDDLVFAESRIAHGDAVAAGTASRGAAMSITLRVLPGVRNVALTPAAGRPRLLSRGGIAQGLEASPAWIA